MSLLWRTKRASSAFNQVVPARPIAQMAGTVAVNVDTAMRHSAVWACLRLRANLISTMPVDVFRRVNGIQVEQMKPAVILNPGGKEMGLQEWLFSSQIDLDRAGNSIGLIQERWHVGQLPARIQLVPLSAVSVRVMDGAVKYKIFGQDVKTEDVWHEKQYTIPGLPVGLSPVAYAAWSIGEYLSVQDFCQQWFATGGAPKAHLKNTGKEIERDLADEMKLRFRQSVSNGDVFVSGEDWTYEPIQIETAGANWIEAKQYGVADIARFFDCPGDLIDAVNASGNITYANITQRNLQFLIMHLGPAILRREYRLSEFLPVPVYLKFNTDALLRMDPLTRIAVVEKQIASRVLTPSEARELDNRTPLTEAQCKEFDRFWPVKMPVAAPPLVIKP